MKSCKRCNAEKPRQEFYPWKRSRDGLHGWCKSCHRAAQREYERSEKGQAYRRKKLYGMTQETYDSALKQQGGLCAICYSAEPLCVDHDHEKRIFRGLLCHKCNRGLGHFDDNPEFLESAVAYLVK